MSLELRPLAEFYPTPHKNYYGVGGTEIIVLRSISVYLCNSIIACVIEREM